MKEAPLTRRIGLTRIRKKREREEQREIPAGQTEAGFGLVKTCLINIFMRGCLTECREVYLSRRAKIVPT